MQQQWRRQEYFADLILRHNLAPLRLCERNPYPIGSVKVNVLPLPTSLSTQILPPCISTNFLVKRQAEPCALALLRVVAARLPELFEDRFLVFLGDADAGVGDGDDHRAITQSCLDLDPPALRRELHGVGQKIDQESASPCARRR